MSVSIDTSELRTLAADLAQASLKANLAVRPVVQKGALNIKKGWQSRWSGLAHAPAVDESVTYDTKITASGFEAEIGPDKDRRQGALGNLLEFGSIKNAPIPGGVPAMDEEAPKFEAALSKLLDDVL